MNIFACLIVLAAVVAPAAADESDEPWEIHGRVVDEQGKPVEDFEAAHFWSSNGKYWDEKGKQIKVENDADAHKMWKDEGVLAVNPRTLAQRMSGGRFSLTIGNGLFAGGVFVTDKEHRRGGVVAVQKEDREAEVAVTLRPLVRVHGKIYCPDAGRTPDWTTVNVHLIGNRENSLKFVVCGSYKGAFSFLLPPGKYDFNVGSSSPSAGMRRPANPPADMPKWFHGVRLEVPAGKPEFDLGVLNVELGERSGIARGDSSKYYGKEPPALQITDACGVDKNVKLADYRGKWLLLDFWEFSCGPCIERGLPDLAKFYAEHAADRERFEILSICVTDYEKVTTKADYEKLVQPIVEKDWQGKPLPFPVLIDGEGRTCAAYGIGGFPSTLLIDPDGKLVKSGGYGEVVLAEKLKAKP